MIVLTVAEADFKYIEIIDFTAICHCVSSVTEYFELSKLGGEKIKRYRCARKRAKEER